jgi:hypothetical protein
MYNTNYFIILCIIGIIYYIFFHYNIHFFSETTIENFNAKSISKIGKSVSSIGKSVNKLPKQIDSKMESLGKKIEKNTVLFFKKKMASIFTQLGAVFKKGLIDPIFSLIIGIGSIFVFLFEVLKLIVDKIISLPNCILFYVFGSIGGVSNTIYKMVLPKFLRSILHTLYVYTFKIIFDWIGHITGYTNQSKKCYAFNVKDEISNMTKKFKKIDKDFKNDFGRLDFSKIKI